MAQTACSVGAGRGQLRFTTPLPNRIRRRVPSGEVLVTLTRGFMRENPDHVDTAHRFFNFSRIGDQAVINGYDDAAMRAAYGMQHLVTITHLPRAYGAYVDATSPVRKPGSLRVPGTHYYLSGDIVGEVASHHRAYGLHERSDAFTRAERDMKGLVKTQRLRPEFGMEGGYFEFDDEEYLHVEVDENGASVLWSSDIGAEKAVSILRRVMGEPDRKCSGFFVAADGSGHDESSAEVVDHALSNPKDLRRFSVGYGSAVVSWRRSQVKMLEGSVPHVELAFNARKIDMERLLQLLDHTATPNVHASLAENGPGLVKSLVGERHTE